MAEERLWCNVLRKEGCYGGLGTDGMSKFKTQASDIRKKKKQRGS